MHYFKWLGHPYYLALQWRAEAYRIEPQAPAGDPGDD